MFVMGKYLAEIQLLKIWKPRVQKNQNIEKITFKVVQIKCLEMYITNEKLCFDIFMVGNLQNIFMGHVFYNNFCTNNRTFMSFFKTLNTFSICLDTIHMSQRSFVH